ncbi:MAG: hypothetical protein A3F14_05560 [Gammaproteobacteria bacterium RIFCSPHIGHO2_12_FULL_43_28]|nr:MAG: hypothetical protein A3F14_05560 [Gammaproteobacteria bacterium RIFCSPHIGHO2_12_FULL_43_28]
MKTKLPRLTLIQEYEQAPDWMMFAQDTVAAIRSCSIATIERDRWMGIGVPFIKMGHLVRYRKAEIRAWLEKQVAVQSTAQALRSR